MPLSYLILPTAADRAALLEIFSSLPLFPYLHLKNPNAFLKPLESSGSYIFRSFPHLTNILYRKIFLTNRQIPESIYYPKIFLKLPTTIYLWLISLTASKELSILLLKLYNDGAIGISNTFLDSASVIKTDNQLLIRSVRFMQVESP